MQFRKQRNTWYTIRVIFLVIFSDIFVCSCNTGIEKVVQKKPNVLFILTDDQSALDAFSLGNPMLKTPNIDQLARTSMRFTNAFTSTAMCVPSRTTLYTGLHPMRHGAHPNHAPIRPGTPTLATHLSKLGYKLGLIGKIHVNPIDSFGFDYVKDLLDFKWDAKLTTEEMKTAMNTLRKDGDPFVLFVCISNPHTPWPDEWKGEPGDIHMPEYLFDNPKTRQTLARYYASVELADRKVGQAIEAAQELDLLKDMVVFFSSDHGAEFVHAKYNLYDAGIKAPFLIRWPGIVKPGEMSNAMIQFVDVVPTLIDIAGGEPVDSLDGSSILPLIKYPGREHHKYIYAISSKDGNATDYPIAAIRSADYKYIVNMEYTETYTSWITDSTLGNKWPGYDRHYGYWLTWLEAASKDTTAAVLVNNYLHRPPEELYDLRKDPNELHNIATDSGLREVKLELRKQLQEWMVSQGDVHYSRDFFDGLDDR